MPKLGESIIEATITKWLKTSGDQVEEDDAIVEIATDKVDSEIPSPVEGKLVKTLYNEGDIVAVGEVIAIVEMDGEDGEETKDEENTDNKEAKENADEIESVIEEISSGEIKDFSASDRFYSPLVRSIAKTENIYAQ